MIAIPTTQTIPLGQVVATPAALEAMQQAGQAVADILQRHAAGDWGDVCNEDWDANNAALIDGGRLVSAYTLNSGKKILVITEEDRSVTTILLPEEY